MIDLVRAFSYYPIVLEAMRNSLLIMENRQDHSAISKKDTEGLKDLNKLLESKVLSAQTLWLSFPVTSHNLCFVLMIVGLIVLKMRSDNEPSVFGEKLALIGLAGLGLFFNQKKSVLGFLGAKMPDAPGL